MKELDEMLREKELPTGKKSNIQMLIIPDMSKASKNSYAMYVDNFKRIVKKHVDKIVRYRQNHCGYKLGFLIFDETPGYLQSQDIIINPKVGDQIKGFPHRHFSDIKLVESFIEADVDFIVWMTPYKNLPKNPRMYPQICVIDMRREEDWKKKLIEYDDEKMLCLERE